MISDDGGDGDEVGVAEVEVVDAIDAGLYLSAHPHHLSSAKMCFPIAIQNSLILSQKRSRFL